MTRRARELIARFLPRIVHSPLELFLTRAMFAAIVWHAISRYYQPFTEQPVPLGAARWIDFTFLADPTTWRVTEWLLAAALVLYTLGRLVLPALVVMTSTTVAVFALRVSQGQDTGATIVGLVLLGQIAAYIQWWFVRARRAVDSTFGPLTVQDLAVHASMQMTAAVYVLAGIAKVVNTGGRWILDSPNLGVSFVMSNDQAYYDRLRPAGALDASLRMGELVLSHPNFVRLALGAGLLFELFAFLALAGRRFAFAIGVALLAMHLSILAFMQIEFRLNILVLLVFFVNVPFFLAKSIEAARARVRGPRTAAPPSM